MREEGPLRDESSVMRMTVFMKLEKQVFLPANHGNNLHGFGVKSILEKSASLDDLALGLATSKLAIRRGELMADFTDEVEEGLLDVDACQGRRLIEGHVPGLGKGDGLGSGDLALVLQVALVAAEHDGDSIGILDAADLLAELVDLVV